MTAVPLASASQARPRARTLGKMVNHKHLCMADAAFAGHEVQALALRLLTLLSRPDEAALVQKLAAHVAGGGAASAPPTPRVRVGR